MEPMERRRRQVEKVVGGDTSKVVEKIPLPDSYDLGVDRRGLDLSSSARKNNQFGNNKRAVF